MTITSTDKATQINNLLALDEEDFGTLVLNQLGPDAPALLWQHLTSPQLVRRTYLTLTTCYNDVCDQLAERAAHMKAFRTDCYDEPDGKQRWFDADRDYQNWRGRTLGYRRLLNARIADAKRALPAAGPKPPRMLRDKKVRLMRTVFELGWAIREHYDASVEADIKPEPHDRDLWDALDGIEVQTDEGVITVAEMLDHLASQPGFVPPSEREEDDHG